jgi:adenine-specific DNA-methyltransferase
VKRKKPTKYDNYTKEQLLVKLQKLEKQRYGLVWKDKPEDVVKQCETELPVLAEVKEKTIHGKPDGPTHYIIEGDNYHSLYILNFTHKKKVDVIYIDPLYNTGNKSWRYNNNYVDNEDPPLARASCSC